MKFDTHAKLQKVREEHHARLVWTSATLVSMGAILFALETLAAAAIISILGIIIQGLSDPNNK